MTEDTSPDNLRKFLESDDPALVQMGLSMTKGMGLPEELLPTILRLYMWDDDKTIRAAAKSVFNNYAPEEIQAKVKENWKASYRTLTIDGYLFQEFFIRPFLKAFKSQDDFALIALEPLIKALEDEVWDRKKAASALGNIGDKHAVEPLIKALEDKDEYVRGSAVYALGEIGDKRAVEPLIKALGDKDEDVRTIATIALGNIGDKRAVEPLIKALGDEEKGVRGGAIDALGNIGDKRAVEPLIKALEDEVWNVRKYAKKALKKLGHEVE